MSTVLQIYVSEDCWGCLEARKIADEMRVEYASARVELIERNTAASWPQEIIATPAYMLNGRLVSLGNPTREELHKLLAEAEGQTPAPAS